MTTIKLNRSWKLGNPFASGGFGKIFEAYGEDGTIAVVKLIPKEPGASRELLFESISGLPNIVPIFDSGEWEDYYILVMPRAEKSLRQHLTEVGRKLAVAEVFPLLTDMAEALASLQVGVIHRDLKPENILFYMGHWCLADFGIARYAEATTAPDTRKYAMTPPYTAPEQWRAERATSATDVYAFGVIAFELLQGKLPFPGPDFREWHLNQPSPAIIDCPSFLASLVNECLFKAPEARPKPANILARLHAGQKPATPAVARLQEVNKSVVEKLGEQAAKISAQQSRDESRRELFEAAQQSFTRILKSFQEHILEAAPATNIYSSRGIVLNLGEGALSVDPVQKAPADCLVASDHEAPFDVIAYSTIVVRKSKDQYGYEGREHSLWFCDAHDQSVYRWYELAFMVHPHVKQRFTLDPFALPPTDKLAGRALSPVMDVRQLAWQPLPFDQGNEDQFIERWAMWFAAATDGTLSHPSHMPEQSGGKFRQP